MTQEELRQIFRGQDAYKKLLGECAAGRSIALTSLVGSSLAAVTSGVVAQTGGVHLFVMEDKDAAGYLYNDLYTFLGDEGRVLFFPTAYKRSIQFGQEDPSGIVQRTTVLGAIKNHKEGYLAVCTYPEALVEKVVDRERLQKNTLRIGVGEKLSLAFVEEALREYRFEKVDFVYEPGQFSIRGGIVDIFSYSDNRPYRVDFFGEEVDSIRHFDLSTQLSVDRLQEIEVVPNLKNIELAGERVSFARFAAGATYWLADGEYMLKRFNDIRSKILADLEDPKQIDSLVTGRKGFLSDTAESLYILLKDNMQERAADVSIAFQTSPQPRFNKNFELLAEDIRNSALKGYTTYLLTENKLQIERLHHIFNSLGEKNVSFESIPVTLHGGFIDHVSRNCFYTDHQIFERFHRYRIRNEIDRNENLTIQELNALKVGDYVVHIDHGVGRFGGLARTVENGKVHEAIKLVYRDNDVLLVNVHALHRISRYKDRDAEPPKIYKLGSGAWQKMKLQTKRAVKDIARELIALYARRKASKGFAFAPDTYMQYELEASFIYEDTPDQQKATQAVKEDMESRVPMDRLICGDVGFGKTEIAVRAAFKAAADSKQVAVLVPTTILALQHYRTFTERLKDFPVKIELLSRAKSAKETTQILKEVAEGKIDILIGTHKILGKDVVFKDLGLLIIDEEQKFGVAAKEKLRRIRANVDTLTLTATPIPRTLQFSLMGSRDLSVINTPPPNRQPVATESHLFDEELIREAVEYEMGRGGQVYFVHNRVENIEHIRQLVSRLCPAARVAVGHGQLDPRQMEKLMMDFIYGEYDVLIATSIIESGMDVPNANTIIINNAHYFGLSDLHQLRGRVGRSNRKAYCYLLTPPDEMLSSEARRRLRAIEEFSDLGAGFNIAMQDLDIRGAGNLLGGEQSGFIADIGFETYQKILNEAMAELHDEAMTTEVEAETGVGTVLGAAAGVGAEGAKTGERAAVSGVASGVATSGEASIAGGQARETPGPATVENLWQTAYLTDSHIETDREAIIPDSYVESSAEKIRLYRELDNITDDRTLEKFEAELTDRFGPIPAPTRELFDVVRLRWECVRLGFEKAIVKNGIMILQFIHNQQSAYYKSPLFGAILKQVTRPGQKFILRQSNNKLSLVVKGIKDIGEATRTLREFSSGLEQ